MNKLNTDKKVKVRVKKTLWYYIAFGFMYFIGEESLVNTYINGKLANSYTMENLLHENR